MVRREPSGRLLSVGDRRTISQPKAPTAPEPPKLDVIRVTPRTPDPIPELPKVTRPDPSPDSPRETLDQIRERVKAHYEKNPKLYGYRSVYARRPDITGKYLSKNGFSSRSQWRWAWATGQPWARLASHSTKGGEKIRYRRLPGHKVTS